MTTEAIESPAHGAHSKLLKPFTLLVIGEASLFREQILPSLQSEVGETHYSQSSLRRLLERENEISENIVFVHHALAPQSVRKQSVAKQLGKAVIFFGVPCDRDNWSDIEANSQYVELPELASKEAIHCSIKMALFKQNHIQQNQSKSLLLEQAFSCIGDVIIRLDKHGNITMVNEAAEQFFAMTLAEVQGMPWYSLIKTRRDLSAQHTQQFISAAITTRAITKIQPLALAISKSRSLLVDGIIGPIMGDSDDKGVIIILRTLTNLGNLPDSLISPGKPANTADKASQVSGLLLFSPDQLNNINLRFGRSAGDKVLIEIGELLKQLLRPTDLSSHYGGANFLVMFSHSSESQTKGLVDVLRSKLLKHSFHNGKIALTFSFGVALNNELITYSPVELFYYANYALAQAQDLGGDQIRHWQQKNALQQIGNFDRTSGNFSETGSSDYQKMLMLWSILNNLEKYQEKQRFFEELLIQLNSGFELSQSAYFAFENSQLQFELGLSSEREKLTSQDIRLSDMQQDYCREVAEGQHTQVIFTSLLGLDEIEIMVAIITSEQLQGFLWLKCHTEEPLSAKDQQLLGNIAEFVSIKLTTIKKKEVQVAKTELQKDTQGEGDFHFWHASAAMKEQLSFVEKVAATSATVLITGESGTGKELLAKSIHNSSNRSNKPFVIFDCGAVVDNLIESELFGHVKGAFTGASAKTVGSIQEAHQGTLFLDEIGELPIETQVKLLRFVQEKQYAAVGSNQFKKVDVRVIAATNVDLEQRIKQGLFREDLYYRLNVFNIESLPLRKRPEDILLLATRYMELYCQEYDKDILDFTHEARQALNDYQWPGNVRELKNLIHRAVILCQSDWMDCSHLGLYPQNERGSTTLIGNTRPAIPVALESNETSTASVPGNTIQSETAPEHSLSPGNHSQPLNNTPENHTQRFSSENNNFSHEVPAVPEVSELTGNDSHTSKPQSVKLAEDRGAMYAELIELQIAQGPIDVPLANWIEHQMFQDCLQQHHNIALQAANQLGIPESSFRRKWKKLSAVVTPEPHMTTRIKVLTQSLLADIKVFNKVDTLHLEMAQACKQAHLSSQMSCLIMGMSAPTFRKMIKQLM